MEYKLNLKSIRTNNNLSQKDIADILNIDRTVYTKYENGYELIPIKHLITLCNHFNIGIDLVFNLPFSINCSNYCKDINYELIASRLKEFRKSQKLTQEKLAKILNTNKSVICNYEKGRNLIATPFLYQICHKYHVSADYLLGRIDDDSQK